MPKPLSRIGAHTPTTGGMAKRSIEYAQVTGAEVIQVFASSPRMWAMPPAKPDLDEAFKIKASELDIHTYVHAPFLINLGSPTETTYLNSLASTKYSLQRATDINALGVVIHTGSAVDVNFVDQAWKQIHEGMMPILNALDEDSPFLLLEPTAGQGQSLVKKLVDLENYLKERYENSIGI
jgi:deoxyribonuclease-4